MAQTINPRIIEVDGKALMPSTLQAGATEQDFILDREWSKKAFLLSDFHLASVDASNRYWSSASSKFTGSTLGSNIGINPRPQFTPYADVPQKGRLVGRLDANIENHQGNLGMGRYYSEALDDPAQVIYMRFGVPQFNSLTNFLTKAFDPEMVTVARTGRASGFYKLGQLAGTAAAVIAFPAISITILVAKTIDALFARPTSKFYTIKPTMHNYWSAVNLLVNTHCINRGLLPKVMADIVGTNNSNQKIGQPFKVDTEYLEKLAQMMPDVFGENRFFDMYAIANKAQRMANKLFEEDYKKLNNGTPTDYTGMVKKNLTGDGTHATYISDNNGEATLSARLNKIATLSHWTSDDKKERSEVDPRIDPTSPDGAEKGERKWWGEFFSDLDAEFRDGSAFAAFRVDHTGSIGESFGTSVIESDLSQKLNGISSQVREARFSFAEGNLMGGLGEMVQGAVGAAMDVGQGLLSGATFGLSNVLSGLAGSGFIDIPKHWQSSTATLPRANYTIQLVSPYNNPISQMMNIYIPLYMLLAGILPLSTGKASYTSPFLCQLYDRGRLQIRLGMIESLSITRGTTNLAFDKHGNALGIDVTFSVVDLSSIMHMPLSTGTIGTLDMTLDEDNILSDYLAVLAGQDMYSQVYAMPKAKLTMAKWIVGGARLTSPAMWSSAIHESATSGALQYLTLGAGNVLEAMSRGTDIGLRTGT